MVNLLKTCGKGILYVIGFPFFLIALLLFGVIGIFLFVFQIIKSIIFFFTGMKFFPELPEDKELRLKQEALNKPVEQPVAKDDIIQPMPQAPIYEQQRPAPQGVVFSVYEETQVTKEPAHIAEEPKPIMPEAKPFNTVEEACFNEPKEEESNVLESLAREEAPVVEEPIRKEPQVEDIKETTLETSMPVKEEEEEELEEYVPEGSSFESSFDEEDTGSGVDIDYNVR